MDDTRCASATQDGYDAIEANLGGYEDVPEWKVLLGRGPSTSRRQQLVHDSSEHRLPSFLQLDSFLPSLLCFSIKTPSFAAVQEFCIEIFHQASFSSQMT